MAKHDKSNLIGYDPLAWMNEADIGEVNTLPETAKDNSATEELAELEREMEQSILKTEELVTESSTTEETLIQELANQLHASEMDILEAAQLSNGEISEEFEAAENATLATLEENMTMSAEIEENHDVDLESSSLIETDVASVPAEPVIFLESNLSIQHVVKLHEKLKASLSEFDHIELNAANVSTIDTATFQLLVALMKQATKLNKQVEISSASTRFIDSAEILGLTEVLHVQP